MLWKCPFISFLMKGEMKWYIVKLAKEGPIAFECCVQKVFKKYPEKTNHLNSLDSFLYPLLISIYLTICSHGIDHFPHGLKGQFKLHFSNCKRVVISVLYLHLVFFIFINAFRKFKKVRYIVTTFLIYYNISIYERTLLFRKLKPTSITAN